MWQTVLSAILVVAAAVYLIRRLVRRLRGKESSGCAFCPHCDGGASGGRPPRAGDCDESGCSR